MKAQKYSNANQIIPGNCIEILLLLPEKSIDMVFADPPYNLQLEKDLWRPNATKVNGVDEAWDQFSSFESYDQFTLEWLQGCKRILKDTGTIWVIGTYHNIFRVGRIMQDMDFWILNDIVWIKNNPMPNFHGVRFTNAHETLIWAQKCRGNKYTFNYQAMKLVNSTQVSKGGLQMRSDWQLPLCTGKERLKVNGEKAHPTQKPEALLERVILASTNPGDLILDPFFGTGTTGSVAKRLGRNWIGIETKSSYISLAQQRIDAVEANSGRSQAVAFEYQKSNQRIPFAELLQRGMLKPGQVLYFGASGGPEASIREDGNVQYGNVTGSIHKVGRFLSNGPCNGWLAWYYIDEETGNCEQINQLRIKVRNDYHSGGAELSVNREEL